MTAVSRGLDIQHLEREKVQVLVGSALQTYVLQVFKES